MWNFINKIGIDKVLHFLLGAVIAFTICNLMLIQDAMVRWETLLAAFGGIVITAILAMMKERIIDDKPDMKDFFASVLGGVYVIIVNFIGAIFNVLSY